MTKPPKGGPAISPARPWDWPDKPRHTLAIKLGGKINSDSSVSSIGWAVLKDPVRQKVREGEVIFRPDQTDAQKTAEAVAQWRALVDQNGDGKVTLYRYTAHSFKRSRAFFEGMSHEHHEAQLRALHEALSEAGAEVKIRTL